MHYFSDPKPLIVFLGPTASGKTEAAISLALAIDGEIISCDSRLFYRGMDIGTAKPSPEERTIVPHHMIDIADPDQPLSLAVFQNTCVRIIGELHDRGKIPILVGGTGQYIFAITEKWEIPAQAPSDKMRTILEKLKKDEGGDGLFRYLEALDPLAAMSIDKRNVRRVIRALEVIYMSGRKFSSQKSKGDRPYQTIQIGIDWTREELYRRIDLRIANMFDQGLIDEVRGLIAKGYTPDLPGMSAIGYNEVTQYLKGLLTYPECVALIKRKTRQYVRRQANWFKAEDPDIHWVKPADVENIDSLMNLIQKEETINDFFTQR